MKSNVYLCEIGKGLFTFGNFPSFLQLGGSITSVYIYVVKIRDARFRINEGGPYSQGFFASPHRKRRRIPENEVGFFNNLYGDSQTKFYKRVVQACQKNE